MGDCFIFRSLPVMILSALLYIACCYGKASASVTSLSHLTSTSTRASHLIDTLSRRRLSRLSPGSGGCRPAAVGYWESLLPRGRVRVRLRPVLSITLHHPEPATL